MLKEDASLHVIQAGGGGQQSSLFLRGSGAGEYRVYLDDVDITDASSTNSSAFIEHFSSDLLDGAEVLKRPSLVDSLNSGAGHIRLNTLGTRKTKPFSKFMAEYGNYETLRLGLSGLRNFGNYHSAVGISYLNSESFSVFKGGQENDPYRRFNYMIKSGYEKNNKRIGLTLFHSDGKSEFDNFGSDKVDQDTARFSQNVYSLTMSDAYFDGLWWPKLIASYQKTDRSILGTYVSDRSSLKLKNEFKIDEQNHAQARVAFSNINSDLLDSYHEWELFGAYSYSFANSKVTLGLGHYNSSQFGGFDNYELSYLYKPKKSQTSIELSAVKTNKSPSLYQLFDLTYGNPNLGASKITHYGVVLNRGSSKISLFDKRVYNEIDFDTSTNKYINLSGTSHQGFEYEFYLFNIRGSWMTFYYSNTLSRNTDTGARLSRRPRERMGLHYFKAYTKLDMGIKYSYVDSTQDNGKVPSYSLFDLYSNYRLSKRIKLTARVNNLFNKDYEQIKGYSTMGRSLFVGIVSN